MGATAKTFLLSEDRRTSGWRTLGCAESHDTPNSWVRHRAAASRAGNPILGLWMCLPNEPLRVPQKGPAKPSPGRVSHQHHLPALGSLQSSSDRVFHALQVPGVGRMSCQPASPEV